MNKEEVVMIKGKRKNLSPEENFDSILDANAGLTAWRQVVKRPRRRVAIAYHWFDNDVFRHSESTPRGY